jgi:hypothetical protein
MKPGIRRIVYLKAGKVLAPRGGERNPMVHR